MNASANPLGPQTHASIFEKRIVPDSKLSEKASHEHPKAILLGGQPGAGKGGLVRAAERELGGDAVKIDPDELRNYYPRVNELRAANPYSWSGHTQHDAGQWADELRQAAIDGKKNLIFDTTLSNGEWTSGMIEDLQAKGYDVEVRVVAASKLESEHGVDSRFSSKLDNAGYGRYVPTGAREAIYDKVPASLDTIHAQTNAPIRIFSREGRELYDSRHNAREPGLVLQEAREARLHDPEVTRDLHRGWQEQRQWHEQLPEAIAHNTLVPPEAAQRLLTERSELQVVEDVQRNALQAADIDYAVRVHPAAMKGVSVAGAAATAYDAATTATHAASLLHQGNATGAQSQVEHFAGRNVGGWAGAVAGAELLGAAGIESGPFDLLIAGAGGVAGAIGGDKLADAWDNHKIYNQTDPHGATWHLDPERPQQGWTRTAVDAFAERGLGSTHVETAPPAVAERLTFQANSTAVELALAHPPTPRDPYTQPAGPKDTPSRLDAPWVRDAQTQQWSRTVTDQLMEHGLKSTHAEVAGPQRAMELDAAARLATRDNLASSPRGIAERYQAAYERNGWEKFSPMPEPVAAALKASENTLQASDGHAYTRNADGQWITPGMLYGSNVAEGHVRAELDAMRAAVRHPDMPSPAAQASVPPHSPSRAVPPADPGYARNDPRHADHPDHALYQELRERIPAAGEKRLLQFTAACHAGGLNHRNLGSIAYDEHRGVMHFMPAMEPRPPVAVDVKTPSPEPQQSIQRIEQADRMQAHVQALPRAHGAQMGQQSAPGL